MEYKLEDLLLEIDVEKTRSLYAQLETVTEGCTCDGCRNYMLAAAQFPPAVLDFFRALGIEAEKATEVIPWNAENGGRAMHYGGFYHLCGRLRGGPDCWNGTGGMNAGGFRTVAAGYRVGFTALISLPEKELPSPALQMEIDFSGVPWLLDKENTY